MTGNRSIFRFLMTLVFAVLIASPQPMVASELSDNAGSEGSTEVTSTPSDDNTGDNPGDPGGDDTTGGDGTTEGQAPEGEGTEGETPDGQTPEDEGTEGEGAEGEGTEVQGPEKTNTDDDAKLIAPANIGGDFSAQQLPPDVTEREYYCDFRNQPSQGSVADWWAADEVAPDCIDFEVIVSDATCSITVNMASWVYSSVSGNPFTWNDSFAWYETDSNGVVLRPEGGGPPLNWQSVGSVSPDGKSLTATFPEDHNGGTAYVLVNFGSPERDIEPGLSEYDVSHWRSTSAGVLYNVNTDCEEPVPVNYCDPAQRPAGMSIAQWLASAPEGAMTDCLDVAVDLVGCGVLDASIVENRVVEYEYGFAWVEGEDLSDPSTWNTTFPISFEEDYNGGSVVVTVFITGPEADYVLAGGSDAAPYAYASGGESFTLETDCEEPVPVNYCHYPGSHIGSVYNWLDNATREGFDTDCIDVGTAVQVCGSLDIPFESRITGFNSDYLLTWAVGTEIPGDDSLWNTTWPITFDEDENGGSVDVIVFIQGPEDDYYHFADEDPYPYPYPNTPQGGHEARSLGGGVIYTVDTDCEEPVPVNYCDASQRPAGMSIAQWLASAPEGAMTDCLDVAVDLVGCGVLDASIVENRVVGYEYGFAWVEGEDISDPSTWNTTFPISFPEDYNGGSVVVTVFITGPEADYVLAGGTDAALYAYANGGYSFTLETDCDVPLEVVTPELPTLVAATCNDDNEPVLPTLTVPETDGITYSEVTSAPANSVLLSLTATANDGYTFAGATLPEGWTLVNSSEAVYEIIAEEAECPTPDPTETPTPEPTQPATPEPTETPKPEDPKEKDPEVTELPTTGTGSNPASMIGLAATAAAAIAGAGLFFTNRKR